MSITPWTSSRRSVVCCLHVAEAGEIEQLFGDFLAAEGLGLDHPQIAANELRLLAVAGRDFRQPAFERFGAHRDRRQRIVDFVGHAGRQKADAGQLLAAHDLLGAHLHLAVEVVANGLKAGGHVVQRAGQLGHFVVAVELNAIAEIARRHDSRALHQHPQRPEHPAIEQMHEQRERRQRQERCHPSQDDQRAIAAANFADQIVDSRMKKAGQLAGERLRQIEPRIEPLDALRVQRPRRRFAEIGQFGDRLPHACNDGLFAAAIGDQQVVSVVLIKLIAIVFEGRLDGVEIRAKPIAGRIEIERLLRIGGVGLAGRHRRGDADAQVANFLRQFRGQRQLVGPIVQTAHEAAIGVDAQKPAGQQRGHQRGQQTDADEQFIANGPLGQHGRPPCRGGLVALRMCAAESIVGIRRAPCRIGDGTAIARWPGIFGGPLGSEV